MAAVDPGFQMWAALFLIAAALVVYALERLPMEVTSLGVICVLLVFFHFFPVSGPDGANLLGPAPLLAGFASPALITVLALLVVGQGLVGTGVLDQAAQAVLSLGRYNVWLSVSLALGAALVVSAFLNNIPVVVIFIPIIQAVATRLKRSPSRYMMPLSFAGILGGMTTLIGSSTNLLVSDELAALGLARLGFFEFSVPGMVVAGAGMVYVLLVVPRLLHERASIAGELIGPAGKQFIAQISVPDSSQLVGQKAVGGFFPNLKDLTVRLILRGEHAFLPPFEDLRIEAGDLIIVAATRKAITDVISGVVGVVVPDLRDGRTPPPSAEPAGRRERALGDGTQVLAEVMVAPNSRLIGSNLEQIGFRYRFRCIVLGMERRARMIRSRITEVPLEAGDVLLVQGPPDDVRKLRHNRDVVLMEWSAAELPSRERARLAALIFGAVVVAAGTGALPIVVAAVAGALAMILVGAVNPGQATQAMDPGIILSIATALALGAVLQRTGGAAFIADAVLGAFGGSGPAVMLSAFFLVVALLSNVISTKASAVLFTPIAVGIADGLGADPMAFAVAVVFAANCAFASPIAYQTNLLVMGPGHYRFTDFIRAGLPLILVAWVAFSLFAPWYYGLG